MATQKNKFQTILSRGGKEVSEARAARFSNRGEKAVRRRIMDLEGEKDAIEEALDAALDINTSNDRNSINAIENFDAEGWAEKMVSNRIKLRVTLEKLQEATKLYDEYFTLGGITTGGEPT